MSRSHILDDERLAMAGEMTRDLPADPVARFDARVVAVMQTTGRDRTWCRQRARELWPDEHAAHAAARNPA